MNWKQIKQIKERLNDTEVTATTICGVKYVFILFNETDISVEDYLLNNGKSFIPKNVTAYPVKIDNQQYICCKNIHE